MSFATEKIKPSSKKIVLVEIDEPVIVDTLINYEAGIWFTTLTHPQTVTGSDAEIGYYGDRNSREYNNIKSCKVDNENYTQVFSIADLRLQNKGFYWDKATSRVYLHFDVWDTPLGKHIAVGEVRGYCDKVDNERSDGCYYNDIYYEPVVENIPALSKNKDPMFFGILKYKGGSVVFNNSEGQFDDIADYDLFGQPCRIYFGFEGLEYTEYEQIFAGYVEDYDYNDLKFKVNIQDLRKLLSRKIPFRRFNQTDYLYLNDDLVNTVKPLAWGYIRNAPAICLNEYEAEPYQFMFVDTTDHPATELINVYVDGFVMTPSNVDLDAGTFELSDVQVNDDYDKVTCDFIGFDVSDSGLYANGADVIKDMLDKYHSMPYLSVNYNQVEWEIEEDNARDVGLYIGEEKEISQAIQDVCNACDMIFFFQNDGKATIRQYNSNRTPDRTIQSDEWIGDSKKIKRPSREYLSSVIIKYDKDQSDSDKVKRYINTDYEKEVVTTYKKYQQKEIETILAWESDAEEKSETIMSLSKEIPYIITRKTKAQNIDLKIMDFIVAEHSRLSETSPTWKIYEIIGIKPNVLKAEVELTMRYVKDN